MTRTITVTIEEFPLITDLDCATATARNIRAGDRYYPAAREVQP